MLLEQIILNVAAWAREEPLVRKVHLFGSRVKGTETKNSDLDVAVEIERKVSDSCEYTTFAFEGSGLRSRLQRMLPFEVQLEWYGGPHETPTVHSGLMEASILVFDRNAQPSASADALQRALPASARR
ncbi:hypothetical protein GCM10027277_08250 [Pseudoduganella ginsengisoli]|uniref:Polymerase nucleotidyl transferase domain-containing protein n=1 Tax=Pseudoduganella ginsengisoli TaxID=1462440 RepID=A0A6L6Q0R8_9BURK|nr:nucleotidyltransferase domain-containing protein [Pseudoduganella ginsengisoli]MTW03235.1 hypothetical protein [Pseudoduganella ginsengisoli]